MPTASAPRARALKMSAPRRTPLSMSTGTRPFTPATTSGRQSMVPRRLFSARPPWFETNTPSARISTASSASSRVTMPFSTTFILPVSFSRLT